MSSKQLTFDEYAKVERMNASTLVQGFKSMLSLKRAIAKDKPEETAAMRFGQQYHELILEPDEFKRRCVVMPDFKSDPENQRWDAKQKKHVRSYHKTKWVTEKEAEFAKENAGKECIPQKDFDRAVSMLESLQSKPEIVEIIGKAKKEQTFFGTICNTECKGRVDLFLPGSCIVDLKGTNNISPNLFSSLACRLHYPEKMAFYQELVRQETGEKLPVKLIVVETSGDFDRAIYTMDQETLDHGLGRMSRLLLQYEDAKKSGVWHGVDEGKDAIPFRTPNWFMPPDGEDDLVDWVEIESVVDDPEKMDVGEYETAIEAPYF